MSGNGRSPIAEDKMLAYIYDDVDDSDIFALEALNTSFNENDAKNEHNAEAPNIKETKSMEEYENLKEMVMKLQKEKEILELRISEVYKTAKAELERKDRRLQELNEEKNNIIFRRNKNFRNNYRNTEETVVEPEKELTNEEFQRFDTTYKIPRKGNNNESHQVHKDARVSSNLNEEVNTQYNLLQSSNKVHQHRSNMKCLESDKFDKNEGNKYPKTHLSTFKPDQDIKDKPKDKLGDSEDVSSTCDSSKNEKHSRIFSYPDTDKDSQSFLTRDEGNRYNSEDHKPHDQRKKSVCVERVTHSSVSSDKDNALTQGYTFIPNSHHRQDISRPRNRSEKTEQKSLRTASISPPPKHSDYDSRTMSKCSSRDKYSDFSRSRSRSRRKFENHRGGPRTPLGSPPAEDSRVARRNSRSVSRGRNGQKHRSRSRQGKKQHKVDPDNTKDKYQRRKCAIRVEENLAEQNKNRPISPRLLSECLARASLQETVPRKSRSLSEEKYRKVVISSLSLHEKCHQSSKENSKSKNFDAKSDQHVGLPLSFKDKDRYGDTHKGSVQTNNMQTKMKQSKYDIRNSRQSRSHAYEKQDFKSRSGSRDRCVRISPRRDKYRRDDKYERDIKQHNKSNKLKSFAQDFSTRNRMNRNRCRDRVPNTNIRLNRECDHKPRNITKLKERILRYSLERDSKALEQVMRRKGEHKEEPKGNETDCSDLDNLRLHLSGTSDEISSLEDIKERKGSYSHDEVDDDFEVIKDLGSSVLQMSDNELQRLLEERLKELHAKNVNSKQEPCGEESDVLTEVEEGYLTETEELHEVEQNDDGVTVISHTMEEEIYVQQDMPKCTEPSKQDNDLLFCKYQKAVERKENYSGKDSSLKEEQYSKSDNDAIKSKIVKLDEDVAANQFKTVFEARQHKKRRKLLKSDNEESVKTDNMEKPIFNCPEIVTLDEQRLKDNILVSADLTDKSQVDNTKSIEKNQKLNNDQLRFESRKVEVFTIKDKVSFKDPTDCSRSSAQGKEFYETKKINTVSDSDRRPKNKTKNIIDLDSYKKRKKVKLEPAEDKAEFKEIICEEKQKVYLIEDAANILPGNATDAKTVLKKQVNKVAVQLHENDILTENQDQKVEKDERCPNTLTNSKKVEIISDEKHVDNSEHTNVISKSANASKVTLEECVLNKGDNLAEYSPVVTNDEYIHDDFYKNATSASLRENSETNNSQKDRSSFIHDFSLSEDDDNYFEEEKHFMNTTSEATASLPKENKINILDITIVTPSKFETSTTKKPFENLSIGTQKEAVVETCSLANQANSQETLECIEHIQEEIQMKQSISISTNSQFANQKFDTEELQKCLEDGTSEAKNSSKMRSKTLTENSKNTSAAEEAKKITHNVKKKTITKHKTKEKHTVDKEGGKSERQNLDDQLMFLFGSVTPSPCKPPLPVSPRISKQQVEQVKRNLLTGWDSSKTVNTVKLTNPQENKPRKRVQRSKSADDAFFANLNKSTDSGEMRVEFQLKSFSSREVKYENIQMCYKKFSNNPNYIPVPQGKIPFDTSNQYICKKMQEYKETHKIVENDIESRANSEENINLLNSEEKKKKKKTEKLKQNNVQISKDPNSKINEICETEKKKKSKSSCIKIKMFSNQSKKRKGLDNSNEKKLSKKKKKLIYSSILISSEDEVPSEINRKGDDSVNKNEVKDSNKQDRQKHKKKSKKNSKIKKNEKEEIIEKIIDRVKHSQFNSLSKEKRNAKKKMEGVTKQEKKHENQPKISENSETNGTRLGIGCSLQESSPLETKSVLRRGLRVRKQAGYYQSLITEQKITVTETSPKLKTPRRITPLKIGEVSPSKRESFENESTHFTVSSKRKLSDSNEDGGAEKFQKLNNMEVFEKCNQSPLPHMEEMLKHLERKTSDVENLSVVNLYDEDVISVTPVQNDPSQNTKNAVDTNRQDQSFTDNSLHQINLDTKDVALLGTFERGIFDNMSEYLLDKSLPLLENVDKSKGVKEKSSSPPHKEGINQLNFSNFLSKNTNTSTPIKKSKSKLIQHVGSSALTESKSETTNNDSDDKMSSQASSSVSNMTSRIPKSYFISPLKRNRRKRVGIVMLDFT